MGHLRVSISHFRVTLGRVTIGHQFEQILKFDLFRG